MAGRRLSSEEREIWSKLAQSVRPLKERGYRPGAALMPAASEDKEAVAAPDIVFKTTKKQRGRIPPPRALPVPPPPPGRSPAAMLDDSWERRILSGGIAPEMSVDLHGYTLDLAHRRLNQALAMAIAQGVRVLLVVTGNPRPAPADLYGERNRGAIRAEIGDWLALSGHANSIASVRTAHPRHGGKGALYIILRRRK